MADFITAYKKKTAPFEGGYSFVPGDNGGETYMGISRKFHPKWDGWPIVDRHKPLKHGEIIKSDMLAKMVMKFYMKTYWDAVGGDKIKDQNIAEWLFDFGVNAGKRTSIKKIQKILNIPITGKVDETTIDAINNPGKYL